MKPKTTIHPELYKLIYKALKDRFIEKEWPVSDGLPGTAYAVWEKLDENGVYVVRKLFNVSHDYFYDRNNWALRGQSIVIFNSVLEKVFRYVGWQLHSCELIFISGITYHLKLFRHKTDRNKVIIKQEIRQKNAKKIIQLRPPTSI